MKILIICITVIILIHACCSIKCIMNGEDNSTLIRKEPFLQLEKNND
jgi:hypothetical protein